MSTEPAIIRASSLGGCTKAIAAGLLGYPAMDFPQKFEQYMEEGNLHEDAIVKNLNDGGFEVIDQQRELDLWIIPGELKLQGHIDGRFRHTHPVSPWRLLEIKTMGDASYKQFDVTRLDTPGLVQKYKWQLSVYMIALNEPATLIVKNRNTGARISIEIEKPFFSLEEIRDRVKDIWDWVTSGDLPERCEETYPCPYHYLHPPKDTVPIADEQLVAMVHEYRVIERAIQQAKALESIQKELKQQIVSAMGDAREKETLDGKVRIVTWKQKNPPRFNKAKAVADGIDVSKYMEQSESPRLKITVKDEDGAEDNQKGTDGGS